MQWECSSTVLQIKNNNSNNNETLILTLPTFHHSRYRLPSAPDPNSQLAVILILLMVLVTLFKNIEHLMQYLKGKNGYICIYISLSNEFQIHCIYLFLYIYFFIFINAYFSRFNSSSQIQTHSSRIRIRIRLKIGSQNSLFIHLLVAPQSIIPITGFSQASGSACMSTHALHFEPK